MIYLNKLKCTIFGYKIAWKKTNETKAKEIQNLRSTVINSNPKIDNNSKYTSRIVKEWILYNITRKLQTLH